MTQGQGLRDTTEQHFLMGDKTGKPNAVHGNPADPGAAGAITCRLRGIGGRAGPGPRPRDQLRRVDGCPAGGIQLAGMVHFDDLH